MVALYISTHSGNSLVIAPMHQHKHCGSTVLNNHIFVVATQHLRRLNTREFPGKVPDYT